MDDHGDKNEKLYRWIPLESNCEIFNYYFHGLGLDKAYCFEELITFDYKDVQGNINERVESVVAIFQKLKSNDEIYDKNCFINENEVKFYMLQNDSLTNACGLIAGLQGIGNLNNGLTKTSLLDQFLTQKNSSEGYAVSLSNNDEWKEYHLKVAVKGNSIIPDNPRDVEHHYVTFILNPNDSMIYELDGRLGKPYRHIKSEKNSLLDNVIGIISKRLELNQILPSISLLLLLKN